MENALRIYCNDAASLLSPVLKSMQAIVSKACSIFNTIYSENATLMVKFVVSVITTLTHFLTFALTFFPNA